MENMTNRYLMGVIKNGGFPSSSFILPPDSLYGEDRKILEALISVKDKADIGIDTYRKALESAMTDSNASMYVEAALGINVTKIQVMEIHDIIISDYINKKASNELKSLIDNLGDPEALGEALGHLRDLIALQPTPDAFVESQMETALSTAVDGASNIIPYGIEKLDGHVSGLNRKEITVIAARPSHGKTSFTCQLVLNWLKAGYKVCFFSKEMPVERVYHKFLANVTEINSYKIKSGLMNDEEKEKLKDFGAKFAEKYKDSLRMYDNVYSVREMESIIAKEKPDIVIDDFIQMTEMKSNVQVRLALFEIMKSYKNIAKEYNCGFVTISQLNRSIENREDPIPRLSDLAESGSIEQIAGDVFFLFYGHKLDNNLSKNEVDLIASKTRYGTPCRIQLDFEGKYMKYKQADAFKYHKTTYTKVGDD